MKGERLGVVGALVSAVWAQGVWGGVGWFSVGYQVVTGYKPLQEVIQAKGFTMPVSVSVPTLGGGGGFCLGYVFVGGSGEAYFGGLLRGGGGGFRVGYPWRLGERFLLLPTLSVGGSAYSFVLRRAAEERSFGQAVDTLGGVVPRILSVEGAQGGLVLAAHYLFKQGGILGLEIGYETAIGGFKDWQAAGVRLTGGPSIAPQRFFVRFVLGGGRVLGPGDTE
ncbi:MAG: hypothetical protein NZ958_08620 [Bacteroidia bacterium]|nr:hypothetical protein [Bacteroidia bacterium]MDW8089758.1 hypothetical protein [Bacteroidia bacterium]